MSKWIKLLLFGAIIFNLAACTTTDTKESVETPDQVEQPIDDVEESDSEQEDTQDTNDVEKDNKDIPMFESQIEEIIEIEGMEEPIVLKLYDNPDALFLTYVPEDLLVEEVSGGEGESYKVYTNYEGVQRNDIFLEIMIFAEHITKAPSPDDKDTTFALLVEDKEEVPEEEEWYDWSIHEYQSTDGSDYVMVGEHDGRYFAMHVQSEPEFSEGFIPRVHKVIEHFYWKDTNEYLTKNR